MRFKDFWISIKLKFSMRVTSDQYLYYLRNKGISIGEGTIIYSPKKVLIDIQRPWMIEIGDYCKITEGVIILQHDYSRSVLRRVYGDIIAEAKKTIIGNNVFIGMNSVILMGCNIGNNVIIGAGSVVTGKIPDNVVVAGNPAKIIRTLDEHYNIRKVKCVEEAKECAKAYYLRYNKWPTISEMGAFFPLYIDRDINILQKNCIKTKLGGDDEREILDHFLKSSKIFESYEKFLSEVTVEVDSNG
jgi:carbonic anhydrase/acetyltransferase-like protein (isoleucine patch superfamily)